jgi:AcrR family transcriptional regulator
LQSSCYLCFDEESLSLGVSHLPQRSPVSLNPRKSPVQARSAASVEAILEATIQVLLGVGKERLTTTRVALRAGVSVGTLYQYFPNKSALLQAALRRHLTQVGETVERVCEQQQGRTLREMVTALITAFLQAKMRDAKTSVALYSVSSDVDGARISQQVGNRLNQVIVRMLATASEPLITDPQLVASMLQGAMVGISRRILESPDPEQQMETLSRELVLMASSYLDASSARPSLQTAFASKNRDKNLFGEASDALANSEIRHAKVSTH